MITQERFSPDEWKTLQFAPLWTFGAVAGADGKIDRKEMEALLVALLDSSLFEEPLVSRTELQLTTDIFDSVVEDFSNLVAECMSDQREFIDGLRQAADIIAKKTSTEEARHFRNSLLFSGRKVAESSGGGVFGLGSKFSKEEKRALGTVATALGISL